MNVVDVSIIVILIFGALIGAKRGFTKSVVSALGFIVAVVLAFMLKNHVSEFLYMNAPFFKFGGVIKGVTVLNIALYEFIAFFIVFSVLLIGVKLLSVLTGIFESFLNMTIILGIPSKILGAIVGVIENFIIVFIVLYILSLPVFNSSFINQSKYKNTILNETPVLSKYIDETVIVFDKFVSLKEKYKSNINASEFNLETLDLFLEYKIITVKSAQKLIEKDKLEFHSVEKLNNVLNKYKGGN